VGCEIEKEISMDNGKREGPKRDDDIWDGLKSFLDPGKSKENPVIRYLTVAFRKSANT